MVRIAVVLAVACAPLAGVAQQPEPFDAARTVQVTATIQAISQQDRKITLLDKDGSDLIVKAGPTVQNLGDIKRGDTVVVIYREGLKAEVKPRGQGADSANTTTVRIDAVDTSKQTISFTRADGSTGELTVRRPDAERFIKTLKAGDELQVTFREAVALSIEPHRG